MTSTIEWFSLKSFAQLLHLFARHAPHTSAIVRHSRYRMESGDRTLCSRQLESPISTTELPGVVLQAQQCRPALRAVPLLLRCGTRNCDPDTQTLLSEVGSAELRPRRPDSRECKCRRRPWAPLGTSAPHRHHHHHAAATQRRRFAGSVDREELRPSWPRCLGQQQSGSCPLTTFESLDEVAVVDVAAAAQFTTVLEVRIHRIS